MFKSVSSEESSPAMGVLRNYHYSCYFTDNGPRKHLQFATSKFQVADTAFDTSKNGLLLNTWH